MILTKSIKFLAPPRTSTTAINPCDPSPCGSNAECQQRNRAAACQCIPEYFGDPYVACRPECVVHSDCPSNKACQRNKCIDPCPGTCGINAECRVMNHVPICTCIEGYIGDPFTACNGKFHSLEGDQYFTDSNNYLALNEYSLFEVVILSSRI